MIDNLWIMWCRLLLGLCPSAFLFGHISCKTLNASAKYTHSFAVWNQLEIHSLNKHEWDDKFGWENNDQKRREKTTSRNDSECHTMKKFNQIISLHRFIGRQLCVFSSASSSSRLSRISPRRFLFLLLAAFLPLLLLGCRNIWNYLNIFKEIYAILFHRRVCECVSCIIVRFSLIRISKLAT